MPKVPSIRAEYEAQGANAFYREKGAGYRNPHEEEIRGVLAHVVPVWQLDLTNVLDLAAGSGEVTLALRELGAKSLGGIDPFTFAAYQKRTRVAAERFDFAQIADGALRGRSYSLIVCSFALHLCEKSRLPGVAQALAGIAPSLLLIMPHKRPVLREHWGWTLTRQIVIWRVRAHLYHGFPTRA